MRRREEGARGCEPFLRHYVIRRFPRGIPTASTASRETWSQRNALCQVIIILLLLFPFVLHLSTVISDIRRIDSSFLSWRGREEEEISVCFAGGRELVDICGRKLRYISYMGICVYVDSSIELIYLKKNSTRCSRAMYSLRYVARGDKDINSRRIEKSSGIERIGTRSTTGRSPDNGHRNRFSNRSNRVVSCKEF